MEDNKTCTIHLKFHAKPYKGGWSKKARKLRSRYRRLGISEVKPRALITAYYT